MPRRYTMDPFQEIRRELDDVFERFMGEGFAPMSLPLMTRRAEAGMISPQLDVCMEEDTLRIEADLPGVDPENVECSILDGVLTIRGERQEKREEGSVMRERRFGRFERRLTLPEGIDEESIQAQFDKGVLTITAHMKPGVGQQRRIQIAGGQRQQQAQGSTQAIQGQVGQTTQTSSASGGQKSAQSQPKS